MKKEDLENLHYTELKSIVEIAKIYNCSKSAMYAAFASFGISPLKNATRISRKLNKNITKEFLYQKYVIENLSTVEIAALTSTSRGNISNRMREFGIERRKRGFYSPCGDKHHGWKGIGSLPQYYVTRLKFGAKSRGIPFEIDATILWELFVSQNGKCALSDITLSLDSKDFTASVDRKDSSKGYTLDNIWWVHKNINLSKQSFSTEEFVAMCQAVASKHPS
jgi:hypothetical protein